VLGSRCSRMRQAEGYKEEIGGGGEVEGRAYVVAGSMCLSVGLWVCLFVWMMMTMCVMCDVWCVVLSGCVCKNVKNILCSHSKCAVLQWIGGSRKWVVHV